MMKDSLGMKCLKKDKKSKKTKLSQKLSNSVKINQLINENCKSCQVLAKKLRKAESRIINLYIENARLRNSSNVNQQNFNNSVSAINPSTFEIDNTSLKPLPQNSVVQEMPENESEQVLNKIEFLMSELTRLMDNLENVKDNTVDNRDH